MFLLAVPLVWIVSKKSSPATAANLSLLKTPNATRWLQFILPIN